jgi:hypothetical protein
MTHVAPAGQSRLLVQPAATGVLPLMQKPAPATVSTHSQSGWPSHDCVPVEEQVTAQ